MPFTKLTPATAAPLTRLICNIEGLEKSGKTDWYLRTAPEPLFYFCFDPNGMEIAKKTVRTLGRDISYANFGVSDRDQKPDFHKQEWKKFRALLTEALASPYGSVCVDSLTEVYDYVRLALFGKTEQIMARDYGKVYAELNDILNEAYESPLNFAIIHKLKPEFVNDKATGAMVLDGWKNAPYAVQANFQLYYDPTMPGDDLAGKFRIQVKNNNMNMALSGWDYQGIPYTADWFTFQTMLDMTFAEK